MNTCDTYLRYIIFHCSRITDVNECTDGSDDCDTNAECTNTLGSFVCECNIGYMGDGVYCDGEYRHT